ncbi:ParB N-terminal domain-containing protein [Rhodoplanes roseus]|uniref:ParB/Sulfiredoxin domain-containing protein n=1 Tax=Rhodoplanes roseus TaxID=29409 RepID=A0A327LAP1_9BRAD|nr:ParB N-terminal domain-containing protein [Rhodoplanes roseus]RAI44798.1 hypothetical protein CH341_07165 [Rhodoplanes roseus]
MTDTANVWADLDDAAASIHAQVEVDDIVVRPEWQVRDRFDQRLCWDYVTAYANGAAMPPIQLARVNGALILMDGAHRLAAQQHMKREAVEAVVTDLSEDEARWQAALANTRNGARLRQSEKRTVFDVYMAQGRYRKGRGVKSYREIAREMGGLASKSAIEKWMKKDHPKIAKRMASARDFTAGPDAPAERPPTPYERVVGSIEGVARQAVAEARALCPTARLALAARLRKAAQALTEAGPWRHEQATDETADF